MNTQVVTPVRRRNPWMIVALIVPGLSLAACAPTAAPAAHKVEAAKVERIEGTNLSRVRLTEKAHQRLGIQTAPVRVVQMVQKPDVEGEGGETQRKVIPYAAVLYDVRGDTWTYTNPESLVFVRHQIGVDYIDGDVAVLLDGPPTNTVVVTVGAPELFGAEFGVGH